MQLKFVVVTCLVAMLAVPETEAWFGGFGGLGLFGLMGMMGMMGRRAANPNITECIITSDSSKLICSGFDNLTCDVTSHFSGLGEFHLAINDIMLSKSELDDQTIYRFLSEKEVDNKIVADNFTLVNPINKKPLTFNLWWSDKIDEKSLFGFRIADEKCFTKFETLVSERSPEELQLALLIAQDKDGHVVPLVHHSLPVFEGDKKPVTGTEEEKVDVTVKI